MSYVNPVIKKRGCRSVVHLPSMYCYPNCLGYLVLLLLVSGVQIAVVLERYLTFDGRYVQSMRRPPSLLLPAYVCMHILCLSNEILEYDLEYDPCPSSIPTYVCAMPSMSAPSAGGNAPVQVAA